MDVWTEICSRNVMIEPLTGREHLAGCDSTVNVRVRLRWDDVLEAVKTADRLKHGDVIYDIVMPPINMNDLTRELELICVRGGCAPTATGPRPLNP